VRSIEDYFDNLIKTLPLDRRLVEMEHNGILLRGHLRFININGVSVQIDIPELLSEFYACDINSMADGKANPFFISKTLELTERGRMSSTSLLRYLYEKHKYILEHSDEEKAQYIEILKLADQEEKAKEETKYQEFLQRRLEFRTKMRNRNISPDVYNDILRELKIEREFKQTHSERMAITFGRLYKEHFTKTLSWDLAFYLAQKNHIDFYQC